MNVPEELKTRGGVVRWARMRLGLSQDELAERVQITQAHVSQLERGNPNIGARDVDLFQRLAKELGIGENDITRRPPGAATQRAFSRGRSVALTAEEAATRVTKQPRRCGLCRETGHVTLDCHLRARRPRNFCSVCLDLPWRRDPSGCASCCRTFAPEPEAGRIEGFVGSPAGLCEDAA
ncbi:MAG TPA: helix-turn-helix transcriptional regulator [Polyangiaceae bacterium]